MVFAVIAILAAITFGISSGVRNTQGKAKAKGELAMISQALDSFKMTHADFPWAAADKDATGDWENFGFVLYSMGPDGKDAIDTDWDGVTTINIREATDQGDPVNLDNIYAGE
jgi:type II secretory pathway pseudopilin PulG